MWQIIVSGLVITIVVMLVKEIKISFGVYVALAGGICLLIAAMPFLDEVLNLVTILKDESGMNSSMLKTLIKITGIGIITEFTSDFCIDAGESALGNKVNFVGKLAILATCVPIIVSIFDVVEKLVR